MSKDQIVKVVILEDTQNSVDGFFFRLQNHPQIKILKVFETYSPFQEFMKKNKAEIAILDVGVPESEDNRNNFPLFAAIKELMDRYTGLALIIISNHSERALIELSLEEGVNAYILKNDRQSMQDLAEIVLQVAEGEVVIPEMTMELFRKHSSDMPSLTPRQWEALSIMFAYPERSQKELADLLTIKPSTFRNLVSQAYIRLGVGGRSAAHRKLSEMGFLPGSDLPPGLI